MVTGTLHFTRSDYERLPEGFPAELVNGALVKEPAPTPWHQRLVWRIAHALSEAAGKERVLVAPTDVFLDDRNVFQPDVLLLPEGTVIRPEDSEVPRPDLVVEVLSPGTRKRDRREKPPTLLRSGVAEVWVVDPDRRSVEVLTRVGARLAVGDDVAASNVSPGFRLVPSELFRP